MRPLARFYAGCYALFPGEHGRVFTSGPAPENPPKRDLVVKVLEQVYYKESSMSSVLAWGASSPPVGGRLFIPCLEERQGLSSPFSVNSPRTIWMHSG